MSMNWRLRVLSISMAIPVWVWGSWAFAVSNATPQPQKTVKETAQEAVKDIHRDDYLEVFLAPPMIKEMCQSSQACTGIDVPVCEKELPAIVKACFNQHYPERLTPEIVLDVNTKKSLDECLVNRSQKVFNLDDETIARCRVDR